ncbi:MAG TPA: ATP-binding protein [Acetobacteraceae bacterium]|nr:ATP-binding protein [Acetobacteraceae bacterium]
MSNGTEAIPAATQSRLSWLVRFWPRSLATRTVMTLLIGLAFVQAAGLTIHAFDRVGLQYLAQAQETGIRIMGVYRSLVTVAPVDRAAVLHELDLGPGLTAALTDNPPVDPPELAPPWAMRTIRVNMDLVPLRLPLRPLDVVMRGNPRDHLLAVGLLFPDHGWLTVRVVMPPPRPWHSPTFLLAFVLMTLAAALLSIWAVRRLTAPVVTLAAAAEQLGRDVNAPPLPEDGPTEVATAAIAFNTMAARIRRFVQDRTFLLTAIGHDLRTPITRLKLRAEFIEDDELQRKFLADLDELEAMVNATLAFGRDTADRDPVTRLDLVALLRTVLDEAGDARPEVAERLCYEGPEHLTVLGRPIPLKRAFANLVGNAVVYGGSARICLGPPAGGLLVLTVEDEGPGIPPSELERVFEPFHRLETSRNRETGGTGLGLPIARNILRAHGGDVILANRPAGGAKATITLPV